MVYLFLLPIALPAQHPRNPRLAGARARGGQAGWVHEGIFKRVIMHDPLGARACVVTGVRVPQLGNSWDVVL